MTRLSRIRCGRLHTCLNHKVRFDYIKNRKTIKEEICCQCDSLCLYFGDCCPDAKPNPKDLLPGLKNFTLDYITCAKIPRVNVYSPVHFVNRCPPSWTGEVTRGLCERASSNSDELTSLLPVTGNKTGLMYKNMFCAICHQTDYVFWKIKVECGEATMLNVSITPASGCRLIYVPPDEHTDYRLCFNEFDVPIIKTCHPDFNVSKIISLCEEATHLEMFFSGYDLYHNEFCATCNFVKFFFCQVLSPSPLVPFTEYYPFSMLLDINTGSGISNFGENYAVVTKNISTFHACKTNQVFNPMSMTCETIVCDDSFVFVNRRCVANTSDGFMFDCPRIELDETEYEILEDGDLVELSSGYVHAESDYFMRNTSAFVCSNLTQNYTSVKVIDKLAITLDFSPAEIYVTLTGLSISLIALGITVFVYVCIKTLQNTPGKNLLSLSCSLFLAELLMLVGPELAFLKDICRAVAILMHYFFLASFFWMNMMAVDVWVTFSRSFMQAGSHGKTSKRFRLYSLFSWTGPALVVVAALMVEFLASSSTFRPNYGRGICWLTNKNAVLIFFAAPLFLITLVNTVLFVATACNIYRSKSSSARQLGSDDSVEIAIYVKLFLVMGLTWVVGFVAVLVPHPVLWYSFIVLNTLQGLFIFLSFVVTAKVRQLVRERVFGRQQRPESRTTKSSNVGSSSHAMSEEVSTGTKEPKSTD